MSFFDDASLAFLPSGAAGKDGKAYSIKPTNGDGDFTFSRGSNLSATRVGADGLIEKGRENLLTYSNDFSNAAWAKSSVSVTSGQSGYDGSSNAWLLDITGGTSSQRLEKSVSQSGVQTASIYAKAGTRDWIRFRLNTSGTAAQSYFDLANGALGVTYSGLIDRKIEDVGGGWYRCSISFNSTSNLIRIYPAEANGDVTHTSGSIYIQDAQVEIGLAATEVIESGATTGKAGLLEDEPRFDYSGDCPSLLLEPSRTQLIGQTEYLSGYTLSNSSIETNSTTSPEGVSNATRLIEDTSTGEHRILYSTIVTSSGADYAYSFFVKANGRSKLRFYSFQFNNLTTIFDFVANNVISTGGGTSPNVKSESYGNDWYRVSISDTTTAANLAVNTMLVKDDNSFNYTGDGTSGVFLYGYQVEQASYPTSYIPNHSGGTITRGADSCTGAGDASTFNDSEGVLYAEISALADDLTFRTIQISDGTENNRVIIRYRTSSNRFNFLISAGGSVVLNQTPLVTDITDVHKAAIAYKSGDIRLYIDGVQIGSYTSTFTISGLDDLSLNKTGGTDVFYSNVKQILYFPTALSDADCITLTTI